MSNTTIHIGAWRVDPTLNRISQGKRSVTLGPRIMDLLVALAQHPGEVVSREALLATVWEGVVVTEETLTVAVSDLRRALEDDPQSPAYIETIRKRGYRLIAPVTAARPARRDRRHLLALAALVGAFLLVWLGKLLSPQDGPALVLRGTPLTSYPSSEITPAFSHGGERVAFAWAGTAQRSLDIYVKQLATEPPLQLTDDRAAEYFPAWSPDDATIAFLRTGSTHQICTVPSIGGPVRRLAHVASAAHGIRWSRDGSAILVAAAPGPGEAVQILRLAIDSLSISPLFELPPAAAAATYPTPSPDGRTIACVMADPVGLQDIWLVPAGSGDARRLTLAQTQVFGLDWTPDGRHLIFAASPAGDFGLWRIALATGDVTWLPTRGDITLYPSVSRRNQLVYEEVAYDYDVWRLRLGENPERLITSTRQDRDAHYSTDGRRIAFLSNRSGHRQIWICDADGGDPEQVSRLRGIFPSQPLWSPNGEQIAFLGLENGRAGVYLLDISRRAVTRLEPSDQHVIPQGWSRDGEWIYYTLRGAGASDLWRTRPDGAEAECVTPGVFQFVGETRDGRKIIYRKRGSPGIWRQPRDGGEEERIVPGEMVATWGEFVPVEGGFLCLRPSPPEVELCRYDFVSGATHAIARIPQYGCAHLAVSPDGESILYDRSERMDCDLIVVDEVQPTPEHAR